MKDTSAGGKKILFVTEVSVNRFPFNTHFTCLQTKPEKNDKISVDKS